MSEQEKMREIMETVAGLMALSAHAAPKRVRLPGIKILQGKHCQVADAMVGTPNRAARIFCAGRGERAPFAAVLLVSLNEQTAGLNWRMRFTDCDTFQKEIKKR